MKKILLTLLLLFSVLGFSQTLTVPTSQEVPVGINGLPINGFSLDGYDETKTYKVSLSMSNGGVFSITNTSGLTRDYGFNSWTNISSVNFTGKPSDIENGLNSIELITSTSIGVSVDLSVAITLEIPGFYYNPVNGHMYRYVSSYGVRYSNAKTAANASVYDGVNGYLVTITSSSEQSFVQSKVSGSNIWIALSDIGREGIWKIDDGPEEGTTVWTTNNLTSVSSDRRTSYYYGGVTATGQYSNWAYGEPNNSYSSVGEDHAVMKWNGQNGWNDLYYTNSQAYGYVIEYGDWTDPLQSTFNNIQKAQTTFTQENIPYLTYKFNFNNNVDITNWGGRMYYRNTPSQLLTDRTEDIPLSSNGFVNPTSQLYPEGPDGTKKATTAGGTVEWCVLYDYNTTLNNHRILIDKREFPSGISATDVTSLQLFDLYDGEVTFLTEDSYWAQYYIYTDTPITTTNSTYSSYIRDGGSYNALKAEFSFEDNVSLPEQYFVFKNFSRTEVQQMIDDMVTVTDVVLAFNELAGGGINGGLKGDLGGIQLALGDVDKNGKFDFQDTYKMLQHLQGTQVLYSSQNLANILIAREKSEYEGYTTQDWSGGIHSKTSVETNMTEGDLVQQLEYNIGFKGDVNLSHSMGSLDVTTTAFSKQPRMLSLSRSVDQQTNILLDVENNNGIIVSLTLPQNTKNITGAQFRVMFDNTILTFDKIEYSNQQITNFDSQRTDYINLGSISTDGSQNLNGGMEYKVYFKTNQDLQSILGLVSIQKVELVSQEGIQIESIVK